MYNQLMNHFVIQGWSLMLLLGLNLIQPSFADGAPIKMIDPDSSTGSSAAVVVSQSTLAHTSLLLPLDKTGQIVGESDASKQLVHLGSDLKRILDISGSGLDQVIQINICVKNRLDLPKVQHELVTLFKGKTLPATTFIAGDLPHPKALVAVDAVAVSSWKSKDTVQILTHPDVFHQQGQSHVALLPWGETVYLSGWVHRGKAELATAVDGTLAFQQKLLKRLGGDLDGVVRIRVFLKPETERDVVAASITSLFKDSKTVPPVVYTPWGNKRTPEIEFIAAGRKPTIQPRRSGVEFFNVPELKVSPVFSRATRINSDRRIYISGISGKAGDSADKQVSIVFEQLQEVLKKSGSDKNHLAKATYFMGNSEAIKALGEERRKIYDPKRPPAASGFLAGPSPFAGSVVNMDMIAIPVPTDSNQNEKQSKSQQTSLTDALATFKVASGFHVELVAAEPLLRDPVAMAFDEFGRMFVVEYPEYNQQFSKDKREINGNIRLLEDTDGDGRFDKSTVYVSGLKAPSAVACYNGGLFVAAAPDVLFCKDTNGDGKADQKRVVFTGFRRLENRTDPSLNTFLWGLDNRFHACTSYSGANVRAVMDKKSQARSIGNRNFLFDPRTLQFDLSSGGGQHGLAIDDWGREFLCTNSSPVKMLMYDDRYLARNPYLKAPAPAVEISEGGKHTQLFRISPEEFWRQERTRLRSAGKMRGSNEGGKSSGFFTAATGVTIYRGDAWPAKYRGSVFVGEPANNLVFRAQLELNGVGLIARRADPKSEFLASTDTRFRPVQFANGPDGNLYVIDMNRDLIEGAMFLPPELLQNLKVNGGDNRGRIYRIVPDEFKQQVLPKFSEATSIELVGLLEHLNGWHRDTASRLLYERQDQAAVEPLKKLAAESDFSVARMTAMYTLDGLNALDDQTLLRAMDDNVANVRIHAIRLAEDRLDASSALQVKLIELTDDSDLNVRYQLAFSLGELKTSPERNQALSQIVLRDGMNQWMQLALLSSLSEGAGELYQRLADNEDFRKTKYGRRFLSALTRQIGAANRQQEIAVVLDSLGKWKGEEKELEETIVLAMLRQQSVKARRQLLARNHSKLKAILNRILDAASEDALNEKQKLVQRVEAIQRLVFFQYSEVKDVLSLLLEPQQDHPVQAATIQALAQYKDVGIPELLIERWSKLTPALRAKASETLFSRSAWSTAFLDAIEKEQVGRGDLDPARVELLKRHPDKILASRIQKLFANTSLERRNEIVQQYQSSLKLHGDPAQGKHLFKKVCSACHRLEGVGTAVGADLKAIRDRGKAAVLLNILDPNREV
ncbi:PVC-type heme-binding CxxCH protein, partial [uncultured Gimesia sp.]|uniref:PVC-type heme-binding CxxCH protein n=1 Tax=uncultured Gimesia sp. TaxID=1678688 RepID=UPI00262B05BA